MTRFADMRDLEAKTGRSYIEREGRLVQLRPGSNPPPPTGDKPTPPANPPEPVKASAREVQPPRMNKTERRYRDEILEPALRVGLIRKYRFEAINIRLGERTFHRPDFYVVTAEGEIQIHEIKGGFVREDARMKFKTAAAEYSEWRWQMWQWKDGRWAVILEF